MNSLFCQLAAAHLHHNQVTERLPLHSVEYDTFDQHNNVLTGDHDRKLALNTLE